MGTFHDNLGELHGITVAVETQDGRAIVGRCHEATDQHVILLDADVHAAGAEAEAGGAGESGGAMTNADWLRRAARWGVFPRHKVIRLARDEVERLTRLNELTVD